MSGLGGSEFSIGAGWEEAELWQFLQREEERADPPQPDALDDYKATLSNAAHPPNECADPYSCATHGEQYRTYCTNGEGR